MGKKANLKRAVDFLMTLLLPALMAFQITGRKLHEWLGAGMLILSLAHTILNFKWYKNLLQGTYTLLRILQTALNISILAATLCLAYSGIKMSGYVFPFVSAGGQMALARQMHMAASYWDFVLMGVHLGFHWGMVVRMVEKTFRKQKLPKSVSWILRIAVAAIAGYGAICFQKADMISYLSLKSQFAFFDFSQSGFSVFTEYTAIMGLWVFFGYYFANWLKKLPSAKRKREVSQ